MLALTAAGPAMALTEKGQLGRDVLRGTDRSHTLTGGSGDDTPCGYASSDLLSRGSARDAICAAEGYRDYIDCGSGTDRVQHDNVDCFVCCEQQF